MAMTFVLDGLADRELQAFNSLEPKARRRVKDPFPKMIMTYNVYLHWHILYRVRFLPEAEVKNMNEKGHAVLHSLVKTLPGVFGLHFARKSSTLEATIAPWSPCQ